MNLTKADVDNLFRPGRVVAVEYLKKDEIAEIIGFGEGGGATHALCCCGGLDIVEASISGIIESNLHNYLRGNCRLTIREVAPAPTDEQAQKAVAFWMARVNDPYDWGMIFGSIPILLARHVLSLLSEDLGNWALRKMPNLLASSSLSTCAELAARGVREFSLLAFRAYDVRSVVPEILRTDDSLNTIVVLDAPILIG